MKFITLGPEESNHAFVARRYIDHHRLNGRASLELAADFDSCVAAVLQGRADYLVQCAVHPATMATVAKWFDGLYVIDTFISPSQDLAILRRHDAAKDAALVVMRPTLDYIDATKWDRIELADTVASVTAGLIDGRHEVGLGYAWAAQAHPELLGIDEFLGTVDDAWIVYGRTRLCTGNLIACQDSPASRLYRQGGAA